MQASSMLICIFLVGELFNQNHLLYSLHMIWQQAIRDQHPTISRTVLEL